MKPRKILLPKAIGVFPLALGLFGQPSPIVGHIFYLSFGKESSNLGFGWNQGPLHVRGWLDGKLRAKLQGACRSPLELAKIK